MTNDKANLAFNLPYNQSPHYWFAVYVPPDSAPLRAALQAYGLKPLTGHANGYTMCLKSEWSDAWDKIYAILAEHQAESAAQVALIPGGDEPSLQEYNFARKPVVALDALAAGLWLGDAMMEDRIVCYMQPVLDRHGKVFGYEAFARVEWGDEVIGGAEIIQVGKIMSAEYILDRHLHVKAITSFISSDLEGFLFINFVPGFIHRPEKYLEGLTEAAKLHGMPAKQLVLDFTRSELARDPAHLKAIFAYCGAHGYSLSLDDISSVAAARKIFETIRPDFVKLDIGLVREAQGAMQQRTISELVMLAHNAGSTVLAEGVETQAVHQELIKAGVDLFQGYLFSPPVAISALKKAVG